MGGEVAALGLIPRVGVRFGDVRPQRRRGDEPLSQNPRLSGVGLFFQIRLQCGGADAAGGGSARSLGGTEGHHVAVGHDGPVDRKVTVRLSQRHRADFYRAVHRGQPRGLNADVLDVLAAGVLFKHDCRGVGVGVDAGEVARGAVEADAAAGVVGLEDYAVAAVRGLADERRRVALGGDAPVGDGKRGNR